MANKPAGADCGEIVVGFQRLFAAAQPERYVASAQVVLSQGGW